MVVAVVAPVPLLWWLAALGSVHRLRFRTVLGIEIPAPPRAAGPVAGPGWPAPGAGPTAWRQLAYLLLSMVIGLFGGIAVAACWSAPLVAATYPGGLPGRTPEVLVLVAALFLAAPWVARAVASVDVRAARALLGPSPAQQLELRVQALARSRADVRRRGRRRAPPHRARPARRRAAAAGRRWP